MWLSCCVLLLFVFGTNGKHVVSKNESELVVAKPRIVVTFLANARQVIRYNETEPEPPSLDPFQRFAQFFFSNILRDLVQPFARLPNKPPNRTEDLKQTCPHGEDGSCPACSPVKPTSKATKSTNATTTTTKTTVELPKHKRHYFLSISGGTVQRTTATEGSEHLVRKRGAKGAVPKQGATSKPGKRVRSTTTVKVKETTATTTKDDDGAKDPDDKDDGEDVEDEGEEDSGDYGDDAKNDTMETFNEGASRSPNLNYSKDQYLLTITTPSLIVFCLMLIAMYFCLKANGFCCRLFLTDPTKASKSTTQKK